MNAPKVVVKRGETVEEFPLPLPIVPSYREMNMMENAMERPAATILFFAGVSPAYDVAVAIYAMSRERGRAFAQSDAEDLLDLPMGAIEVVYADEAAEEAVNPDPLSGSGSPEPESDSGEDKQTSSESSTSETPEGSGIPE
jgi:hypothetical protein